MQTKLMDYNLLTQNSKIWTLSNIISLLRLGLAALLYLLIVNHLTAAAIFAALLAILSDYLDGYYARKRNEISELGKILDPVADKFAVALGSLALFQAYGLPLWVVLVIVGRDMLIVFGSLILMRKIQRVESSEMPGKIAVTVISLLLLVYLFQITFLQKPLLVLTALSLIFSFSAYATKFVRILKSQRSS
ncbi:MAG: CDP-alcohol phosphatidyltransferase family protein [Calditrichia bacterium]